MQTSIKLIGIGDRKTAQLEENLRAALLHFPPEDFEMTLVSEVNQIALSGVTKTPALLFDGTVVLEGEVPEVEKIVQFLKNRNLYQANLYRLRRILVPVDFSPASKNAFEFAVDLAQVFSAEVEVFHAVEGMFDAGLPSVTGQPAGEIAATEQELADFIGEKYAKPEAVAPTNNQLPNNQLTKIKADFGFAAAAIETRSTQFDLVVMSTTGHQTFLTKIFGSVSTSVSTNAHCPVLLVPPSAHFQGFKNILYASNFESADPEKIRQVADFSKKMEAQLHFVHVGHPGSTVADLEKAVFKIHHDDAAPDQPFIFEQIMGDDVVEKLHEYAFEHRIDLLVFVTHRRGIWQEITHRSISKKLLFNTFMPVLVVHQFNDLVGN